MEVTRFATQRDRAVVARRLYLALLLAILFDMGLVWRARARDPFRDLFMAG